MAEPAPLHPLLPSLQISTHSRPKAAGGHLAGVLEAEGVSTHSESRHARRDVSTHSRPKAAGAIMATTDQPIYVSTHSRPKAAGSGRFFLTPSLSVFQHTAARRRLANAQIDLLDEQKFQHTAARRRLVFTRLLLFLVWIVSTHSRPKAAGLARILKIRPHLYCFNTQPPEGGWCKKRHAV